MNIKIHVVPSWIFIEGIVAFTLYNHIFIVNKFKNNKALIVHESTHSRQYSEYSFFLVRYIFSSSFRYKMELEAYANQIKFIYDDTGEDALPPLAYSLYSKYALSLDRAKIYNDLKQAIRNIKV